MLHHLMQEKKPSKGFTLIELLVVISIISLLSSMTLANLHEATKKARDAKRLGDFRAIVLALQLFYEDNGHFPDGSNGINLHGECVGGACGGAGGNKLQGLLAPYVAHLPRDPLHNCPDTVDAGTIETSSACLDAYYYSYDFTHALGSIDETGFCNPAPGILGDDLSGVVAVSINRLELPQNKRQDTCVGNDMHIDTADYNVVICENGTGLDCFQQL